MTASSIATAFGVLAASAFTGLQQKTWTTIFRNGNGTGTGSGRLLALQSWFTWAILFAIRLSKMGKFNFLTIARMSLRVKLCRWRKRNDPPRLGSRNRNSLHAGRGGVRFLGNRGDNLRENK